MNTDQRIREHLTDQGTGFSLTRLRQSPDGDAWTQIGERSAAVFSIDPCRWRGRRAELGWCTRQSDRGRVIVPVRSRRSSTTTSHAAKFGGRAWYRNDGMSDTPGMGIGPD